VAGFAEAAVFGGFFFVLWSEDVEVKTNVRF